MTEVQAVPPKETVQAFKKIIPIFGFHLVGSEGSKAYKKFEQQYKDNKKYPGFRIWPKSTIDALRRLNPSLVLIDSRDYDPLFDRPPFAFTTGDMFSFPGDPFNTRTDNEGFFIVDADIPMGSIVGHKLYSKNHDNYPTHLDLAHEAVLRYWEFPGDWDIEDQNIQVAKSDLENNWLAYKDMAEFMFSFGMGVAGGINFLQEASNPRLSTRRRFINKIFQTAGALGAINNIRLFATAPQLLRDTEEGMHVYKPWEMAISNNIIFHPIAAFARNQRTILRNAVASIKLREVDNDIPQDQKPAGPLVTVFGALHGLDYDIWNDPEGEKQRVKEAMKDIFKEMEALIEKSGEGKDQQFRKQAVERMVEIFGGTRVWKVNPGISDMGSKLSRRKLFLLERSKNIEVVKTAISPTIRTLAFIAAQEQGFLSN